MRASIYGGCAIRSERFRAQIERALHQRVTGDSHSRAREQRALSGAKPMSPEAVARYLSSKFGANYEEASEAMRVSRGR